MPLFPSRRRARPADDRVLSPIRLDFDDPERDSRRRVLILLLGVAAKDMGRLIDLAERSLDPRRDEAVVVVSDLDFSGLRDRGLLFEFLPDAATLKPDSASGYRDYVRRKLDLIRLKWVPAVELDFGQPADRFIDDNTAAVADSAAPQRAIA